MLLIRAMKKILLPPFADQQKNVSENDDAENSDQKKIVPEKIYVVWSLHGWCLLIRNGPGKVADKI